FFSNAAGDFNAARDENLVVYNSEVNPGDHTVVIVRQAAAGSWRAVVDGMPGVVFNEDTRQAINVPGVGGAHLFGALIRSGPAFVPNDFFIGFTAATDAANTPDENYRGYGYLQDQLARNGFVVVSISLDDMITADLFSNKATGIATIAGGSVTGVRMTS